MSSWLKSPDSPAKVGQKVCFDMKPDGENKWVGQACNPEDGKTYESKMTLKGKKLKTEGRALFGLVCQATSWTLL